MSRCKSHACRLFVCQFRWMILSRLAVNGEMRGCLCLSHHHPVTAWTHFQFWSPIKHTSVWNPAPGWYFEISDGTRYTVCKYWHFVCGLGVKPSCWLFNMKLERERHFKVMVIFKLSCDCTCISQRSLSLGALTVQWFGWLSLTHHSCCFLHTHAPVQPFSLHFLFHLFIFTSFLLNKKGKILSLKS